VIWQDSITGGASLFATEQDGEQPSAAAAAIGLRLRRTLGCTGEFAAQHSSEDRWSLLYSIAYRAVVKKKPLIAALDGDARAAELLAKAVKRDVHKMKAFVRFRRIEGAVPERFVAWHRPEHRIVRLIASFFARRFSTLRWTIFTPWESADWDGETICFGAGVPSAHVKEHDALEHLWKTYYSSIFNPARIKLKAMTKEMPKRHWSTLPETTVLNDLVRSAPDRVRQMIAMTVKDSGAEEFVPRGPVSLPVLAAATRGCSGCGLSELATQTVTGEGPTDAEIMLLGEQPGDEEDRVGRPFVGPAGTVLDEALLRAGLNRRGMYVTNSVKHFKFEWRGQRRIHRRPSVAEIRACGPWLEREIAIIKPKAIIMLGATAGQALLGPGFRVHQSRGRWIDDPIRKIRLFSTVHPSMILRTPEGERERAFSDFVSDLVRFADDFSVLDERAGSHRSEAA
jgi:DNA polymerase